jgi:predicted DNA-binding transcriptional regulator AlpA
MLLNVTRRCLQDWRLKGTGPRFIRMTPKLVQYRRSDLEKFIEERAAPTERTLGERSEPSRRGCELRSQQGVSELRI